MSIKPTKTKYKQSVIFYFASAILVIFLVVSLSDPKSIFDKDELYGLNALLTLIPLIMPLIDETFKVHVIIKANQLEIEQILTKRYSFDQVTSIIEDRHYFVINTGTKRHRIFKYRLLNEKDMRDSLSGIREIKKVESVDSYIPLITTLLLGAAIILLIFYFLR
ncbi:MAG: hypothetical protein AAF990_19585 [Bacteroidota bacterium]